MMGCPTVLIGMAGGGGAGAAGAAAGAAAANFAVKTKRRGGVFGAIVGKIVGEIVDAVAGAAIGGLPGAIIGGIVGAMKGGMVEQQEMDSPVHSHSPQPLSTQDLSASTSIHNLHSADPKSGTVETIKGGVIGQQMLPGSDKAIETAKVEKAGVNKPIPIAQANKSQGLTDGSGKAAWDVNKAYAASELGILSARYESNGNPGIIANNPGDPGGKSYGAWQFNTKDRIVTDFYRCTQHSNNDIYTKLNNAYIADGKTNGTNFDAAWKKIASENPTVFLQLQRDYAKKMYYDNAANKLKNAGFDINKQSLALQNVLWSTAIQHGADGCVNIFKKVDLSGSQADIITNVYNERGKYFSGCSQKLRDSVRNRFKREKEDALNMLNNR
ncbi:MAG: hypothetical protein ABH870_05895 [bacterium]